METSIFVTDLAQQFSISLVGSSLSGWPEQASAKFSDPRSFLPFSLSAACLKFCQTHVTTLLQEWPAFRFRAAPPGDDPTLIDRVAA
jgi:hypothetical protein